MTRYLDADTGGANCTFVGETGNTTNTGVRNWFGGFECGNSNTSGSYMTATGRKSCTSHTTGDYGCYYGYRSGQDNVGASRNNGFGADTLMAMALLGEDNCAFGTEALKLLNHANADKNCAIGNYSLATLLDGFENTTIGFRSGYGITSGAYNFCGGAYAGDGLTTATGCTFTGYKSGFAGGTSSNNTAYGAESMTGAVGASNSAFGGLAMSLKTGTNNVSIGYFSMAGSGSSSGSVGIGYRALQVISGGEYNLAAGFEAGRQLSSGDYNVYLGYQAGKDMTTGSHNICLGYQSATTSTSSYRFLVETDQGNFLEGFMGVNPYFRARANLIINAAGVTTSPPNTYDLLIQATSNTNAQLSYRGSDGVVRSGNITLS